MIENEGFFYRLYELPMTEWDPYWDRIFTNSGIKEELLNYARLAKNIQPYQLSEQMLNIHGVILLYGPPGNGKTSLAMGFANRVSREYQKDKSNPDGAKCIYLNPNQESKWLGESQKRTQKVFQLVKDSAKEDTYTFCILDEAESLLINRDGLGGSDPSDVLKSVNLVLRELDELVAMPQVFLVATSNLTQVLDRAFMDRTDRNFFLDYPDIETRSRILRDSFKEMNAKVGTRLKTQGQQFEELVYKTQGLSGRRLRKLVIKAYLTDRKAAENPSKLELNEILQAIHHKGGNNAQDPSQN